MEQHRNTTNPRRLVKTMRHRSTSYHGPQARSNDLQGTISPHTLTPVLTLCLAGPPPLRSMRPPAANKYMDMTCTCIRFSKRLSSEHRRFKFISSSIFHLLSNGRRGMEEVSCLPIVTSHPKEGSSFNDGVLTYNGSYLTNKERPIRWRDE